MQLHKEIVVGSQISTKDATYKRGEETECLRYDICEPELRIGPYSWSQEKKLRKRKYSVSRPITNTEKFGSDKELYGWTSVPITSNIMHIF